MGDTRINPQGDIPAMPRDLMLQLEDKWKDVREKGLRLSGELVAKEKFEEALRSLNALLKMDPDDVEVLILMAHLYTMIGNLTLARRRVNKALKLEPENPHALYQSGVIYGERGDHRKAISEYEKAIGHFGSDRELISDTYVNLGCTHWNAGNQLEALDSWKASLRYNPRNVTAKRNLDEFSNEYGMPGSPVGMDDIKKFVHMKLEEYLLVNGQDEFRDRDDMDSALKQIMEAWNGEIAEKYGSKLDDMTTAKKLKLFRKVTVFKDKKKN